MALGAFTVGRTSGKPVRVSDYLLTNQKIARTHASAPNAAVASACRHNVTPCCLATFLTKTRAQIILQDEILTEKVNTCFLDCYLADQKATRHSQACYPGRLIIMRSLLYPYHQIVKKKKFKLWSV